MTTSYSKNIHLYYCIRDFWLTVLKMSIKTRLFFLSDFPLYHYSNFWYYRSLLYYKKFKKNPEKNNKLRIIYPKNQENIKTSSLGTDFTGSYKKECKFPKNCSYTHLSVSFGDLFAFLVLSFCQSSTLLSKIITIVYSVLE